MRVKGMASVALAAAFITGAAVSSGYANTVTDTFSGTLGGNAVSGSITLDVSSGQATDGTGTFTGFGLVDVPMLLITSGAPNNVTFESNNGDVLSGGDTYVPIDSVGLIFDVLQVADTSNGKNPLFNLASGTNNSTFYGQVPSGRINEIYGPVGTIEITPTPLPSTWTMLIAGFVGLGFLAYRGSKKSAVGLAAA